MITGKDLYNSYYKDSEKLFSTGNEDLDDILEEVYYSGIEDGYDYAQKEFGEKMSKEDRKALKRDMKEAGLSKDDQRQILAWSKNDKNLLRDIIKSGNGDKDASDRVMDHDEKLIKRVSGTALAASTAPAGALIGYDLAGKKGAIIGGTAGAVVGMGGGYLLGRKAGKVAREQSKHDKDPRYKTETEVRSDKARVALRKMTPQEFKNKWGRGYEF